MEDLHYYELLAKTYPSIQDAAAEIINLKAILHLPKGTEHFLSDIHGEYDAFAHMIKSGSGVIKDKIEENFPTYSKAEKDLLATLIYYPKHKLDVLAKEGKLTDDFYRRTISDIIEIAKITTSKYTISKVRKAIDPKFSYIIEELLQKKKVTYKLWLYLFWQIITFVMAYFLFETGYGYISNYKCLSIMCKYLVYNVSCNIVFSEGGMVWILLGVLFYYSRGKIKYLYPAFVCVYALMDIYCIPARIAVRLQYYKLDILYDIVKYCAAMFHYDVRFIYEPSFVGNYQWMMIFSLIFFILYNGKYGKGLKKLFYIYYPAHIVILFFIGKILC